MNLAQHVCQWFLGQVWNWVTWGQKLGHWAKSAENLVNTLAVTFLKQSSWILLKMFVLMSSRSGSNLGYLGSKTRSPGQISRKFCWHSSGHIFEESSWILLKMFVLMISRSGLKLGHMRSKTRSPGQISRKLLTLQRSHFLNNHHKYCSKCSSWWFLGLV